MKANELRIGNLVFVTRSFNTSEKQAKVKEINLHYLNMVLKWNNNNYITSIILTKEWLLMLGFKYNRINNFGKEYSKTMDDGFIFYIELRCDYVCYITGENNNGEWEILAKIQYVHQLQNIYFALTGKELNLRNDNCKTLKITNVNN